MFSVIIVNYNAGELLFDCVHSIINNHYDVEIIVVDNNSSDVSINRLQSTYQDQVNFIMLDNNVGFSKACNIGSAKARGEYLVFLNPDCILFADCFIRVEKALGTIQSFGMLGGFICNAEGKELKGTRRRLPTLKRSVITFLGLSFLEKYFPWFEGVNDNKQSLPNTIKKVEAVSGAFMLISRKIFKQLGGFDEDYFLHCEDLDLMQRLSNNNHDIYFDPQLRVIHYQGTCSRTNPYKVLLEKHRSMYRFYQKFQGQNHFIIWRLSMFFLIWSHFLVMLPIIFIRSK